MSLTNNFTLVFGLTADPIHLGHEQVIINSVSDLQKKGHIVDKFILMPVFAPNLIAGKKPPQASFRQRVKMCEMVADRLSIQLNTEIIVSDIEKHLSEKSGRLNFSVDTLEALKLPRGLFIASADHFKGRWPKFRKWHRWKELVAQTGLLINKRPGNNINYSFISQLKELNEDIFTVESDHSVNTSSTYIRKHFSTQSDMSEHLSADIIKFIRQEKLYLASAR